jgi:8-oxo-dGTP pyrophosphatase MutT (NUDIX family)
MARDGSQFLNAHVFPGGQVEAGDIGNRKTAALRELYEETNIYLQPDNTSSSERPRRVIPQALQSDSSQTPYSQFLQSSHIPTAETCLIPFSRWITPKFMPKRFDTTFFLALASPADHPVDGRVDGQEIKSLAWLSPTEALSQFSSGKITLFPPQWYFTLLVRLM